MKLFLDFRKKLIAKKIFTQFFLIAKNNNFLFDDFFKRFFLEKKSLEKNVQESFFKRSPSCVLIVY